MTDPFGGESRPSVPWKDRNPGDSVVLIVDEPAQMLQQKDFESGEPAFWPPNADGTRNPKMAAVVNAHTEIGEEVSVWAPIPSSLQAAIRDAQKKAGALVAPGGRLVITLVERKPNAKNPRLNPQNIFAATYTPPNAFADQSAAAPSMPAPPAQPAVSAPVAPPAGVPSADQVAALRTKLAGFRAAGLSDAVIATLPGVVGLDGTQLTPDAVASILG